MATNQQKAEHFKLAGDLAHQRTIHSRALALLLQILTPPPPLPGGKKGLIVFGYTSRVVETTSAVLLLVDRKLIEDASALVRMQAESVINAAFIAVCDETMALRFDAWGDFMQAKQEEWTLDAFPKSSPEDEARERASIDRLRIQALKEFPDFAKQRGMDFWKRLPDRAKVVDDVLGQRDFAILHETWRTLSNFVHQNALALRRRIGEEQGGIVIGRIYTNEDAANVLFACNESVVALCMAVDWLYCGKRHAEEWGRISRAWRPYAYS